VKATEDAFSDIMKKTQGMVDKAVEDAHARAIEAAKMVLKSFLTSWQFVVIVFTIIIISVSIAAALSYMPK
jgi:mannose/fructose/N-acetylgalactosamine-specific phosphotransferase system component IIC